MLLSPERAETASDWVCRWLPLVPAGATALDLACGRGRHFRLMAEHRLRVTGVDRDADALEPLKALGETIVADIEAGSWPLDGRAFDLVVVTNYLWRPLLPAIVRSVAPGGLLVYETFCQGHEQLGRPQRSEFLLRPGELLQAAAGLRVVAYEDGFLDRPPRRVQRLCALRPGASTGDAPGALPAPPLMPASTPMATPLPRAAAAAPGASGAAAPQTPDPGR